MEKRGPKACRDSGGEGKDKAGSVILGGRKDGKIVKRNREVWKKGDFGAEDHDWL